MILLLLLPIKIYPAPVHKLIRCYVGYSDEEIEDEKKILKKKYDKYYDLCKQYYSEEACRKNYLEYHPDTICNENGFEKILNSLPKNVPILDIKTYGYSGKIDFTVFKQKIPVVNLEINYGSKLPSKSEYFAKKLKISPKDEHYIICDYKNNISFVGNIKNKVSHLSVGGRCYNFKIIDGPIDCDTFRIDYGTFIESDQQIKSKFFIADQYANPTINWKQVKCTQFIYDISHMSDHIYIRIAFENERAFFYCKALNGDYYELHFGYNAKYDNFIVPYDSVDGEIGVISNALNVDVYLDTSNELKIKVINVSFYGAFPNHDMNDDDTVNIYTTSNNWNSQKGNTKLYIYADKDECVLHDKSKLPSEFVGEFNMVWSEQDNNYYHSDSIYYPNAGNEGNGLKKSIIIIIACVCAAVLVIVIVIIVVIVFKKKKVANKNSSGQQ